MAAWILLGLVPGLLYLGHLLFGANQTVAALWLASICAIALAVALALPQVRIGLFDLEPMLPVALLFLAVIGVALWTLTPWTPGGPHPVWAWAGQSPGAATVNVSATAIEIVKLLGLGCVFMVGCLQGARRDRARTTLDLILILGAVYAAISLLTFLTGKQILAGSRLSGGFLTSNSAATVFGVLTVIGMGSLLRGWRQSQGLGFAVQASRVSTPLAFVLLFATCLLLTASRMGAAATAVAAVILLAWEAFEARGRRWPILIGGGVLVLVAIALLAGGNDLLWQRADELERASLTRGTIYGVHWRAFLDSPLFGYGLGTFPEVNAQLLDQRNYADMWNVRTVHNVYLQWLEEAGIVGSAPMFALVALILAVALWRTTRLRSGQTLLRALVAANAVVLVHGTTDFALQEPSFAAFWAFLLGLQFAFGQSRS